VFSFPVYAEEDWQKRFRNYEPTPFDRHNEENWQDRFNNQYKYNKPDEKNNLNESLRDKRFRELEERREEMPPLHREHLD